MTAPLFTARLYDFGKAEGDSELPSSLNVGVKVDLQKPITFYEQKYDFVYVSFFSLRYIYFACSNLRPFCFRTVVCETCLLTYSKRFVSYFKVSETFLIPSKLTFLHFMKVVLFKSFSSLTPRFCLLNVFLETHFKVTLTLFLNVKKKHSIILPLRRKKARLI